MLKASSLKIDTRSRKKGVYQFDFSPSAEAVDLDPSRFRDIVVTGSVSIASAGMVVQFTVTAVATLECDRTLVDFDQEISGDFKGLVADATDFDGLSGSEGAKLASGNKLEGANPVDSLKSGDSDLVPMFEGVIVLDDVVRDTVMLAVPMRKISPAAAALELKLEYGKDEDQIDPRWEGLKRLGNDPV